MTTAPLGTILPDWQAIAKNDQFMDQQRAKQLAAVRARFDFLPERFEQGEHRFYEATDEYIIPSASPGYCLRFHIRADGSTYAKGRFKFA